MNTNNLILYSLNRAINRNVDIKSQTILIERNIFLKLVDKINIINPSWTGSSNYNITLT